MNKQPNINQKSIEQFPLLAGALVLFLLYLVSLGSIFSINKFDGPTHIDVSETIVHAELDIHPFIPIDDINFFGQKVRVNILKSLVQGIYQNGFSNFSSSLRTPSTEALSIKTPLFVIYRILRL